MPSLHSQFYLGQILLECLYIEDRVASLEEGSKYASKKLTSYHVVIMAAAKQQPDKVPMLLHKVQICHLGCKAPTHSLLGQTDLRMRKWTPQFPSTLRMSLSRKPKLFPVSEQTEKFLISHFTTVVSRRQWRDKFGAPDTSVTACPR